MGKKKQAEEPQAVAEAVDELVAVIDDVDVSAAIAEDDQARELSAKEREHYEEICRLNRAVVSAEADYEVAKADASAAKRRWEQLQARLTQRIAQGANPQPELPFPEETAPTEDWKSVAIGSVLELTDKQAERLEEAGIKTVGEFEHLRSGQMDGYPDGLRSLKGVGQKTVDAWEDQMVEWLSVHSRESQAAEAAESDGE